MRKSYLLIILMSIIFFSLLGTWGITQPSYCQQYSGDNICDDSKTDCGSAYVEPADEFIPESGSITECNECQTGGYDCSKSLLKEGPDSPLCKAYYGDNICDDTKEKCGNDYKVDKDGKPISVASCQECSTGGFSCLPSLDSFKEKYAVEPDERRLTGRASKEKIREAILNNIYKVVITDLDGKEDVEDVQVFADIFSSASFNFLAVKKIVATFDHPQSGKCTETLERYDYETPIKYQYLPHIEIATSFLSTMKCENPWTVTQTQWSNAATLESFFWWTTNSQPFFDLMFDKEGRQLVFATTHGLLGTDYFKTGYLIPPPIPITKGPSSALCQTFGSCTIIYDELTCDSYCDDTKENCVSGYVEGVSEPSCQECSTGKWKDCKVISENYCRGQVINNLCYMDVNNIPRETYEDNNFKIWATFNRNNLPNTEFDFNLFIKNKLNTPVTIDYQYSVRNGVYEKISTNFLTNDEVQKKGLHINLQPNEEKVLRARFKVLSTNKLAPFLTIQFWYNDQFLGDRLRFEDITAIEKDKKLIWSFSEKEGPAIACNNIVYPSANCCSNNDCNKGVCIDGLCMANDRLYPVYSNNIDKRALAIGDKKILYLSLSDNYATNKICSQSDNKNVQVFNIIENFYDNQAKVVLNENPNFINFHWTFIKLKPSDFGITKNQNRDEVINNMLTNCAIDFNDYDLLVFEVEPSYASMTNCGGPGCYLPHKRHMYLESLFSNLQNPSIGNTLTHEMNHFFGAVDYYVLEGSSYQWDGSLQGPNSNMRNENPNMLLVRAEIGWSDLNQNGLIDVKE